MPLSAEELIAKSQEQRRRKRYEEALTSALAAIQAEPDNSDAWWQVALSRLALGDTKNEVIALRKVVDLWPSADNAWAHLGTALAKLGEEKEARKAFSEALDWNEENVDALEGMAKFYAAARDPTQDEAALSVLERIERLSYLDSDQSNFAGIIHYRANRYHEAIKYWRASACDGVGPIPYYNLGLAYGVDAVSQEADAVDMWRLVRRRWPNYDKANERLDERLPRLQQRADAASSVVTTLLPKEDWYQHYINPYELLDCSEDANCEDYGTKELQGLRKALLQEIELEDGAVSWLPGAIIDKSRAIGVCEELNDDNKRWFHWYVFLNKPLLAFLTKGAHEHFLVRDTTYAIDTIELLDDTESGFAEWLSELFAAQFARILCLAIERTNIVVLEVLLDGRRWVRPAHADRCFESARRLIDRLLQPLRDANAAADDKHPSMAQVKDLLERKQLVRVMNLLPTFFEDFQNEAVQQVRGIAVSAYNSHDDIDASRQIVELAKLFRFRSAAVNKQIEDDVAAIDKLIQKEHEHDVKWNSAAGSWEITKRGAVLGRQVIAAEDINAIRWGSVASNNGGTRSLDFLLSVADNRGTRINYTWRVVREHEKQEEMFTKLIDAALHYLMPTVVSFCESRIKSGYTINIGPCKVSKAGIQFEAKGWLFSSTVVVPWHRVRVNVHNGDVTVYDQQSEKTRTEPFSFRETDNASLLRILADIQNSRNK